MQVLIEFMFGQLQEFLIKVKINKEIICNHSQNFNNMILLLVSNKEKKGLSFPTQEKFS